MDTIDIGGQTLRLTEGEVVLWQGQPVQGVLRDPKQMPSGLGLIILSVWLFMRAINGLPSTPVYLSALILLFGAYLTFVHMFIEKHRRARTHYLITNQRAILAYSLRVLSLPISAKTEVSLKKGRYDLVLFKDAPQRSRIESRPQSSFGFGHLENGEKIYQLALGLKNTAHPQQV